MRIRGCEILYYVERLDAEEGDGPSGDVKVEFVS